MTINFSLSEYRCIRSFKFYLIDRSNHWLTRKKNIIATVAITITVITLLLLLLAVDLDYKSIINITINVGRQGNGIISALHFPTFHIIQHKFCSASSYSIKLYIYIFLLNFFQITTIIDLQLYWLFRWKIKNGKYI